MKLPLLAGLIGMAWCGDNDIQGPGNVVISGKHNQIKGKENTVDGWKNHIKGDFNDIEGDKNDVKGDENLVDGNGNLVIGSGNIVMGQGNFVSDNMGANFDMNWAKNLQSEGSFNQGPQHPLLSGFGMGTMNQHTMPGQFNQQEFVKNMEKEMEMRFKQMGRGFQHPLNQKSKHHSENKIDM